MSARTRVGDFVGSVAADFAAALDAKGLAAAGEEQAEVVVDFGGSGYRGARIARGIFLPDGDGRGDTGDFVDIGLFHALEELAGVGGERFDVAALAFGVDGVKGQRGFAGTADAGDDGDGVVRNVDGDVFEIVDAGAADAQDFLLFEDGRDGFVRSQREAQTARFPHDA